MSEKLEQNGWELLPGIYDDERVGEFQQRLATLSDSSADAVRQRDGAVYAARNVLDLCPEILTLWRTPRLEKFITKVLGSQAGLVRALFFDKPPEQTWALPWHKDLLIAVANDLQGKGYSRPRPRAGVLHSEPPLSVLEQMLTLRIHLDPMTPDNGPLQVLSGSHRTGKTLVIDGFEQVCVTSAAGDVLAMRPLLVHSSGRSDPDCSLHRRVLHLEFAALEELPGGVEWQRFEKVDV
ncbi:phytanoyl-CoA dioxygenase family protein [Planctomicrobium piriforme]|uniref:Phytanoyl-CoA dioxygenase (PhyH) n=1 Tax=Planctomicrobium piriforme TaxID=1576369 RepID=A0A1I3TG31_9PLAN|nr:phytanoyl-CoA dioxygenase family protein [Planctomicrobium piriforme]SFJ70134.1 Phytanoyl-CoA dioxygenase (PhyH) [Planctomicrobium piriforme]